MTKSIKKNLLLASFFMLMILISSCSKDSIPSSPPEPTAPPVTLNFTSDKTSNLTVVYFVPKDNPACADYERRLSEILLAGQEFYRKEMERNGFGPKTFGILKDVANKRVKIITVMGALTKDNYPYSGGAAAVRSEVDAYFASHPGTKTSEHVLIIMPKNHEPAGNPYYGVGKYCYASDNPNFDYKHYGTNAYEFTTYYGGLMHELGHGLNLLHNCEKMGEMSSLGTALMGTGNYTLGESATFLTKADCAILNANQVFNNDSKTYYGSVNSAISRIHAVYSPAKGAIIVGGRFSSNTAVNDILFYNDPKINETDMDYNAPTWTSKVIAQDSFYVEMPLVDLKFKDNYNYQLRIQLVHDNGVLKQTAYTYKFVNSLPVLNFGMKNQISKQGWTISASSQEVNTYATNIIDGNLSTYWMSGDIIPYPHEIVIDMGESKVVKNLSYNHRATGTSMVKDLEVQYSTDGTNFISAGSFVIPDSGGTKYFDLLSTPPFRYFKMVAKSSYDGGSKAAIGEIGLWQ